MWHENSPALTRRNWIALAGAGLASWRDLWGFGKDFWESKDAAEWSADEISRLLSKSPWAKIVSAERVKSQKNTMPSDPMPPPVNPRGRNTGMGNPRMPKQPSTKTVTTYTGQVVWESAAPVRAALKSSLPEGFEGQYVLGMSGVPLAKSDGKGALDKLRQATSLHTRNHQPLEPGTVKVLHENGTVYLFGFSKEGLAINREEKEVVFATHMGNLAFTAKFNPRDMLYHGELSL